jgi:mannobiose 2-epimerase
MSKTISTLIKALDSELENILNFWIEKAVDKQYGGFVGSIDQDGKVNSTANKGAILNARILWSFSAAYNYTSEQKYRDAADRAFDYLKNNFIDTINGGVFWELDYKGVPVNTRKQAYAQGFAIYGLSEYYKASGNKQSLELAKDIFEIIENRFFDNEHNGYIEALGEGWEQLSDMRLSPKDANEPKSMNTHLHILEPYTNLYRYWKSEKLAASIKNLIDIFLNHIINNKTANFQLFFDYDWTVKSDIVSYGHDIEGSWLLFEAAQVLNNSTLMKKTAEMALRMVDTTIENGMAPDGSVYNEKNGEHLDTDRHWWPQAEALVGLVNAWQLSNNINYLSHAEKIWHYIDNNIIDKKNREWFWKVNNEGKTDSNDEKVGFWKCPYHNSRAMIEVAQRLKK